MRNPTAFLFFFFFFVIKVTTPSFEKTALTARPAADLKNGIPCAHDKVKTTSITVGLAKCEV